MSFRIILFLIGILINYVSYRAIRRSVIVFLSPNIQRWVLNVIAIVILLLNFPILLLFYRQAGGFMHVLTPEELRVMFFPTSVWMITMFLFLMVAGPICIVWLLAKLLVIVFNKTECAVSSSCSQTGATETRLDLTRRNFLTGSGGLLIPGIFAVTSFRAYGSLGEIDITPEQSIRIPHLSKSMKGLRIAQISDIHVGPYLGRERLQHVVELVNKLNPDVIFITGDIIDRDLSDLPDTLRALTGLHAPLGTYAIMGNHDISSDPYSHLGNITGGVNITHGLNSIGIQTLRNEIAYLGSGQDRVALLGLDWFSQPGDRRFYSYRQPETRSQLHLMMEQIGPGTPTILLAHHPDTFEDAAPLGIGLTLAGHTHGGQVVLANINGVPISIATSRFRYLSGLYQVNGSSLYVSRGIGYFGIPIRINCHPEISSFKLEG
jgi:uncharacterized protein